MPESVKSHNENRLVKLIVFRSELSKESDRGCALYAAAYLDQALSDLLYVYLVDSKTIEKDLFDGTAPLSNFSSRITMSFYLGLISDSCRRDLNLIRRIRNYFAHSIDVKSFDQVEVAQRCRSLYYSYHDKSEIPRSHYVSAVFGVLAQIHSKTLAVKGVEELKDEKPTDEAKAAFRESVKKAKDELSSSTPPPSPQS